jgi:hypothetical protein
MDRTLPYFIERIEKDAIDQNKRVLISSSENAIRGLLMHLCDIPQGKEFRFDSIRYESKLNAAQSDVDYRNSHVSLSLIIYQKMKLLD